MHGAAPRKRNRNENGSRSPSFSVTASSSPLAPCSSAISLPSRTVDAVALELEDEVVGHRLAQVGPAVQQRDERAAAREPDRRLRGRVAAADDPHARRRRSAGPRAARRRRRRSGPRSRRGRRPAGAGTRRRWPAPPPGPTTSCPSSSRSTWRPVARLQRERPVRRRRARAELARLGDRAAGQLHAADPGREAEVVLDPPRRAGLAAERGGSRPPASPAPRRRRRPRRPARPGRRRRPPGRPPRAASSSSPTPIAREITPFDGLRSSAPPGSRTSGSSSGASGRSAPRPRRRRRARCRASSAAAGCGGRSRPRAGSPADERGPTTSMPTPWRACSASRRAMNADSTRSASGPSSTSSGRSASRSTAM